jgi:hypothetical protein
MCDLVGCFLCVEPGDTDLYIFMPFSIVKNFVSVAVEGGVGLIALSFSLCTNCFVGVLRNVFHLIWWKCEVTKG